MESGALVILGKILALIFLVLLNGFFVAAEFAIVKVRDTQLQPLLKRGHQRAKAAMHVLSHLDRYLSSAQIGITLASLGLGWIGEPVFAALLSPVMEKLNIRSEQAQHTLSFVISFSIITFLHITAGEQAPKWLAIQRPVPTTIWVVWPLQWFYKVSYPFIWMINQSSLWLLRRLGIHPASEGELAHSEEELRLLFAEAQRRKGVPTLGRDIVLNALELRERIARDVMRPRQEIALLDTNAAIAECLNVAEKTRFSRLPLCEDGDPDRMLGVVHIKDMFAMRLKARRGADLTPVARKLIYVPASARLEKLLQLFLERRSHFAIVVDEFGGTLGIVTLENILEELVGPIQDEFDQEKPLAIRLDDQTWELAGSLPLHDLAELAGTPIESEGMSTTSGWVTHKLGGFPKEGDILRVASFELSVEEMDGPRVARLKLRRIPKEDAITSEQRTAGL